MAAMSPILLPFVSSIENVFLVKYWVMKCNISKDLCARFDNPDAL